MICRFEKTMKLLFVKLDANIGLGGALNKGLEYCEGDMIARMDSDDISHPDRFKKQLAYFEKNPDTDVLGSFVTEIDFAGNVGNLRKMPLSNEDVRKSLWACPMIHPTVMIKKESLVKVGGYDSTLRRRQDYELWFRGARFGWKFANIPEPLLLYRFDKSTHKKQPIKLAFEQGVIGFKGATVLNMPFWKRLACFVPFLRSFLPAKLQHKIYWFLKRFDPRQKGRG